MNQAEALAYITDNLQPDSDPVLSPDEVVSLLDLAKVDDADGNTPDLDAWTPTYDRRGCARAIAEGWLRKRGKAVGRFEFITDGQTFRRQQILDQIDQQRRLWARRVPVSPSTLGATS
jgi:hypothetical protein